MNWCFLHVELSHDDLRQIGMEKKPEGDQNNQSNPTEGTKPATPGKLPTFFIHRMYTMVQRNVNFVKNEKFIESVMFFSETQEDIPEWEKELQAELQVKTFLSETSSLCQ